MPLRLETALAEERYQVEPETVDRPELVYDRSWAQTLLELVLRRLREDCERAGKGPRFLALKAFLDGVMIGSIRWGCRQAV